MSSLLPDGIAHLGDCPYTVYDAILTALRILAYEEHPREDRPAKRIWMDNEALTQHWNEVEARWRKKYGATETEDDDNAEENAFELIDRG